MTRTNDPLLQPYQLKHLRLRNRVMTTSHEPAYSEGGLPKDGYRLYHVERAKADFRAGRTQHRAGLGHHAHRLRVLEVRVTCDLM